MCDLLLQAATINATWLFDFGTTQVECTVQCRTPCRHFLDCRMEQDLPTAQRIKMESNRISDFVLRISLISCTVPVAGIKQSAQ